MTLQRYLLRDADSLLPMREQATVQVWQECGEWLHMMRDYALAHTHEQLKVDQHFLASACGPRCVRVC